MRIKEDYNNFYLAPKELDKYIDYLKYRKNQIREKIRQIGEAKLGKEKVEKIGDEVCLIAQLNTLEKQGRLTESKIKDELQSYDILRNPQYSRLCELKNVLDYNKG